MNIEIVKRALRYIFRGTPVQIVKVDIKQVQYNSLLKNKKVVVTGGGHGIGRNIAEKCLAEGADILIIGRNEDKLKKAAHELGDVAYIVYDLEDVHNLDKLYSQIIDVLGYIDCLVCNAGVSLHEGNLLKVAQEQFEKQIRINLESIYFLTQIAIKNRIEKKPINIICISSERGFQCDDLPYGLSKAALNSFVKGVTRRFYRENVRINGIAPGITTSDLTQKSNEDDLLLERVVSGRYFLGEEIAEVVCFLLSDATKCISGEVIACDAGEHISSYI